MNQGGWDVAHARPAGRVSLGRGAAGGGPRAARGFGEHRRAVERSSPARADRRALAQRGRRARSRRERSWAPDDRDGHLRSPDGGQAPLRLGLRDPDQGGLRLAAPAQLLRAFDLSPRPGRVDGPQAHPAPGLRGGRRDHPHGDRQGGSRAALLTAGRADRLDRDRGRRPLSLRRDARPAGSAGAGAPGQPAGRAPRPASEGGPRPLAGDRAPGAPDLADDRAALGRGPRTGDRAQPTGRGAASQLPCARPGGSPSRLARRLAGAARWRSCAQPR